MDTKLNAFVDSFLDEYYGGNTISESTDQLLSECLEEKAAKYLREISENSKQSHLFFSGPDFMISSEELDDDFLNDLMKCGGSGEKTPQVEHILNTYKIDGDPEDVKNYLTGYGAWDDSELEDHRENLKRLVWLTGAALSEEGEAYFSTY